MFVEGGMMGLEIGSVIIIVFLVGVVVGMVMMASLSGSR